MPPLPSVPNVVKIVLEGTTPANPYANVWHWGYTGGPPSLSDANNLADAVFSAITGHLAGLQPLLVTRDVVTLTDLSSALGAEGVSAGSVNGTRVGTALPGQVCALVSKTILRRYRGGHPRTYLYAGVEADTADASNWSGAFASEVTTAYINFRNEVDGLISGATTLTSEVTVSYIDKVVNPVPPYRRAVPAVFNVGAPETRTGFATQRRRVGRG